MERPSRKRQQPLRNTQPNYRHCHINRLEPCASNSLGYMSPFTSSVIPQPPTIGSPIRPPVIDGLQKPFSDDVANPEGTSELMVPSVISVCNTLLASSSTAVVLLASGQATYQERRRGIYVGLSLLCTCVLTMHTTFRSTIVATAHFYVEAICFSSF